MGKIKMASKKKKPTEHRSFKKSPSPSPFVTLKFTHQSVYWTILSLLVLALGVWVINLNVKVQKVYDQVDQSRSSSEMNRSTHKP
jgi:hypothetical protein